MFAKLKFRNLLMYVANLGFSTRQVDTINIQFKTALLDYASETPDNTASIGHIEIGKVEVDAKVYSGLKIRGKNILLSDIMYGIENMSMPAQIQEQFPELTQQEWEAATRIMFLMLSSLED